MELQVQPRKRRPRRSRKLEYRITAIFGIGLLLTLIFLLRHFTTITASDYKIKKATQIEQYQPQNTENAILTSGAILYHSLDKLVGVKQTEQQNITVKSYTVATVDKETTLMAQVEVAGKEYFADTHYINIEQTHPVNNYIANSLNYPKIEFTDNIRKKFGQKAYKTDDKKPSGVVIHDTGNENTLLDSEVTHMVSNFSTSGTFVHTFIDAAEVRRIADENYTAQGAGKYANRTFVQFEMTRMNNQEDFARQTANAAYYTASILKQYQLGVTLGQKDGSGSIWTHEMVSLLLGDTDHIDPVDYWNERSQSYFGQDYGVEDFMALVQAYYNQL